MYTKIPVFIYMRPRGKIFILFVKVREDWIVKHYKFDIYFEWHLFSKPPSFLEFLDRYPHIQGVSKYHGNRFLELFF